MNLSHSPLPSRLARDSTIVGAATILSRLLGFARDVLIARLLGAGPVADAFLAALRLPNLVRRVLGEGGLNAPFVPVYLGVKAERGADAAARFAGQAVAQLGLLLLVLVGLGEIFAAWIVLGLAGGFADQPDTLALAAGYTRLMLPFLILTTLASLLGAMLTAERRFAASALLPAAANALLLVLLVLILMGQAMPDTAATAFAACVSLTGAVQLAMVVLALRHGAQPLSVHLALRWSPDMTRLLRTGGATLLAASAAQLVLLIATQIASGEAGAVSALYYADRIFQLPLGFVGVAMGTVALADMAQATSQAEHDATLGRALGLGLALALPAATALAALADPIVSVLFEHGRFGAQDRARTAAALSAFALGLPFAVVAKVFGQVYFARRMPRIPLLAGLAGVATIALAGLLLRDDRSAAMFAALAATAAFVAQAGFLTRHMLRDRLWRPDFAKLRPILAALCGSGVMLLTLLFAAPLLAAPLSTSSAVPLRILALGALCMAGLLVYAGVAWLLGAFGEPGAGALLRLARASARRPRS